MFLYNKIKCIYLALNPYPQTPVSMKKDRISLFILLFEIVAITAMHATKNRESLPAAKTPAKSTAAPIFSTTALPPNSNLNFFVSGTY